MPYRYKAYGLPILSDVTLPGLAVDTDDQADTTPVRITFGPVLGRLHLPPLAAGDDYGINERELWHVIPGIMRYYVANGTEIVVEALTENRAELLVYLYANSLAAVLFQRNLIPLHVSGVWVDARRVLLFAAPSQTGKSTLVVKLQERGYPIFTDDTALLTVDRGRCFAQASYPMVRLWQDSIGQQAVYADQEKQRIFGEVEKYGFSFHEQFCTKRVAVAGLVFLDKTGTEPTLTPLSPVAALTNLSHNVYRAPWLRAMKKQRLQFEHLSAVAATVPAWRATRPETVATFAQFPDFIVRSLLESRLPAPEAPTKTNFSRFT